MHDTLFEHPRALDDSHLTQYARAIGLDEAQFTASLNGHEFASHVRRDFSGGIRSGVNGTPTFYINGVRHDDSWDVVTLVSAVKAAIEAA
jgi:protein-disulfide isomerase